MPKLSERAMLASLHRGSWSGQKHDQEVTEETATRHKADVKEAGRYSKQLIPRKALAPIANIMGVARQTHRVLTLPWDDDGTRILSARGYAHYTQAMRVHRLSVEGAAKKFIQTYQDHINAAKQTLGSMFDPNDYPSPAMLKGKFYIDVEIKPMPEAGDFRTKLSDDTTKAIMKDIESRTEKRVEAAINDVFERIVTVTGRMSERLKEYKPEKGEGESKTWFKDSLVYNVKELADLLPSLNITDDARLDQLSKQLLNELVEHSPEVLRSDAKKRKQTADKAARIHKQVTALLA